MITPIELGLSILISSSIVFYLACALFTWRFFVFSKRTQIKGASQSAAQLSPSGSASAFPYLPVSILVPVCGVDARAWENWTSFCTQEYPDYEVLFGVTDPQDPCIPLLQKLVRSHPERAQLFSGLKPRGINYKDSNLSYLLEEAHHEIIIFADSDICVRSDYIRTVTAPLLEQRVGMVTCAFIGYTPRYLGAALASLGRCVDFIPSLLIARVLDGGLQCAIGATIATRRSDLDAYGGLQLNRIGSDYNLGKRAAAAGYRVELSRYVLDSDTGTESISQMLQRELRWARTIRFNRGAQYYSMAFCFGTVYCLPLLFLSGFSSWAIALTVATWAIRYIQAFAATFCMNALELAHWLWTLPLRDILSFVVWVMGGYGSGVYWRGRHLRIEGDGLITQWQH
jgi:ceramide glucosyltransferase